MSRFVIKRNGPIKNFQYFMLINVNFALLVLSSTRLVIDKLVQSFAVLTKFTDLSLAVNMRRLDTDQQTLPQLPPYHRLLHTRAQMLLLPY